MRQIELSYRRRTMRRAADCEPPAPTWGDLPGPHHILRLEQIEQVALGRKDVSIPRTNGGADIFRLAGLLRRPGRFWQALSSASPSTTPRTAFAFCASRRAATAN